MNILVEILKMGGLILVIIVLGLLATQWMWWEPPK
jgi:hypothetical protein